MVAFHEIGSFYPTIAGESVFRNKILKLRDAKGLISDHDCELHRGGTAGVGHLAGARAWRTRIWTVPKLSPILYKSFSH